ncbi:aminopeptidase N [Alterisphingorhabdus coralli]|uniref:Aminopeptidase N n=1 Tax=Alterisphingorhabdus coralli TaxID=3071408 RepID=A0AA97F6U6_9SPHN|nr:aminopeptidase N [Parasphingorhabdus sp. SCSIO 66989]WOE75281.1 aminopeptidase N [Parasphingorhabdus sp. SCSIO 66989]
MSDNPHAPNKELAEAATPPTPPTIYRKDYRPPDWLVPDVALGFDLDLAETLVQADIQVTRNGDHGEPLRLEGDGLEPEEVLVDGAASNDWRLEEGALILPLSGDAHRISITTRIQPDKNTQLMGLYASNDMLCTQCEAEGFRRITFFPDRPDVLSRYTVEMRADKERFPVLLSNGNLVREEALEDGRHLAEWHDPWPKPSYLFALVAGDLVANRDSFTTMSGKEVDLAIWVRPGTGDLERTGHAMTALKNSMRWDEERYGREYDLAVFNIVAVSDFNMGAMENKGLNIFNSRYILADPDTATDADFDAIEGVVAHEYFHNWSGNRVTCRDWFQLSLKEGFTVFRDQSFSADMGSAPVKRIEDVRVLRAAQFPEDGGPLAHPIRPDSYMEISNFYTATVYNKGAEVIRMMATLAGDDGFRKATDLYFDRHDGEAATCEDFVLAMEDGAGLDLTVFRRWYEQAGTPQVTAKLDHDPQAKTATLTISQSVPDTPGQSDKQPMVLPLKTALIDRATGQHKGEQLLVLEEAEQRFTFDGFDAPPALSINRGFSAPVTLSSGQDVETLAFLARHDDDSFARYEALQQLVTERLVSEASGSEAEVIDDAMLAQVFADILADDRLEEAMRAELLTLPSESFVGEQMAVIRPDRVNQARQAMRKMLGANLAEQWQQHYVKLAPSGFAMDGAARGARRMRGLALAYLVAGEVGDAAGTAHAHFEAADNMTDRQTALASLAGMEHPLREQALDAFYTRYKDNALVLDKWFSLQALSFHPDVLEHIAALAKHPDFTLANPNRVRSLYGALAGNPSAFHHASGQGYRMLADMVIALDPKNAQTAARFIPPLGRWRRFDEGRAGLMRAELERIRNVDGLSRDTTEQVVKSLG